MKTGSDFRICSEPIVHLAAEAGSPDVGEAMPLLRAYDRPILFALARDKRTIFAGWNIDWTSVFQKSVPLDRQVYLRVFGGDGSERKRVAVEPMVGMHYLATSGLHDPYHVEIGYYQAGDLWHSVAISDPVKMPLQGVAEIVDVDVATIPFHLSFQQLVNLFGTDHDTPLAKEVSKFQRCVLNGGSPNELRPKATVILDKLTMSLPEVVAARRHFEKSDIAKLPRNRRALLQFAGTSPSGGLEGNAGS